MDSSLGAKGNAITKKTSTSSQALLNKKKEIVDKIMVEVFTPLFNQWLDQACRPRTHGCDGHDSTSTGSDRSNDSGRGGGAPQRPPGGQKRRLRKDDQDDRTEEDDDDDNDGRRGRGRGKRSRTDEEEIFKNDDGLKEHQRSKTPCPLKTEKPHDGFNKAQEKQLKSRQRPGANEIQKWEDMYRILFPEDLIPSPYYDGQYSEDPDAEDGSKSHYAKLENFLRRQLPPIIRSKLEQEVERELNCVEDIMKDKAVQIFQNTTLQLLQLARGGFQEASNSVPNIDGEPGPSESALPPSFDTSVLGDPDLGELFSSEFTFDNFYNFPMGQAGFEEGVTDLAYEPTSNACSRDSYGRCPATECEPLRTRKTHAPVFT
ncbi:uncharacterized protein E0L32_009677 [Thyridium curvatum]|uniref:Uncharacterized protein n=1 Tax=Thyridium curvatum TaxID=1093900 RepID=A0A507AV91_9PEZI|nr:uncharacterized protein E0L32_009677 [Thyridium curvatum]TPX08859.1 hypothetical protein E0L32_009677 [Thyridium curvatum]